MPAPIRLQTELPRPTLVYVYDALCSWCFGFEPVMQAYVRETAGVLDFELVSGGMNLPGSLAALVGRSKAALDAGLPSDLIVFALPIQFRGYYPGYAAQIVEHHDRASLVVLKGHTTQSGGHGEAEVERSHLAA